MYCAWLCIAKTLLLPPAREQKHFDLCVRAAPPYQRVASAVLLSILLPQLSGCSDGNDDDDDDDDGGGGGDGRRNAAELR
jgi:hypothetical protein